MNRNKKTAAAVVCVLLAFLLTALSACGKRSEKDMEADGKIRVVTTLFPYYDFTRQIAGDRAEISMVIPAGMDSHSFEPTPTDIRLMQNADILICNGGEMEQWVAQVLSSLDTSKMQIVTMMDHVEVVPEELIEGMETDEHEHEDEQEDEFAIEYDEHIWTSPVNAAKITCVIAETLQAADAKNADFYEGNTSQYLEKLNALNEAFLQVRSEAVRDIIIMGDKFPLRYFADTYDLRYRAAFSGCAGDTEPSAKTIAYLIDMVKKEEIPVVYYLELSSHRVAEIIGEETGAKPLLLHSCHNVTRSEFEAGVTYLELMEQNVENLREGLCK